MALGITGTNTHPLELSCAKEDELKQPDRLARSTIAADGLNDYFRERAARPCVYTGQLTEQFQRELLSYHIGLVATDCDFYHSIDLYSGQQLPGSWDLRGHEKRYLGGNLLNEHFFLNKRIAEFGPASGALTAYLAKSGAHVTVFDLPFGSGPELVPFPEIDMAEAQRSGVVSMTRLRNSWWFVKSKLGYHAEAVYSDIYNLPDDLGRFDVAIFGALLLHLSNPFRALQQAAALVNDTIIITEIDNAPVLPRVPPGDESGAAIAAFNDGPLPSGIVHWWSFSPAVIVRMLERLGFKDIRIDRHTPPGMNKDVRLFTVVGRRQTQTHTEKSPSLSSLLPIPPGPSRFLVSGTEQIEQFLTLGQLGFMALTDSLHRAGVNKERAGRILDFGCGVGRVMRYWADCPGVEVHGTDIEQSAVDWCNANLQFAKTRINSLRPILDYADSTFDVIYTLSVFTHLPQLVQVEWFEELLRILKPGGLIYFTTHGEFYAYLLEGVHRDRFNSGDLVVTGDDQPGTNICAAFHPHQYVVVNFTRPNDVFLLEHIQCGAKGNPNQDSYLVRKNP
jgi:2-polyprenyl-3-methyl-5-hydroxy-6-metoxy-1,4-benzoquinol methylase